MRRRMGWLAMGAGVAALVTGCAATGAVQQARQSFEAAGKAGAEAKAPYEYYAAREYLRLAQLESDEVDGKAAREFAARSEEFSQKAVQKAGGGAQ